MLHWSLVFLVIAIIAAILGFGGIAGTAVGIAKILFFGFRLHYCSSSYDNECNDSKLRRTELREGVTPFVALFVLRIFLR
jgi:uncharacterized membrane protein YtjA (UPF0391 family)